jgi:hypothetical protein
MEFHTFVQSPKTEVGRHYVRQEAAEEEEEKKPVQETGPGFCLMLNAERLQPLTSYKPAS